MPGKREGQCRLHACVETLTFEHIPPRATGNRAEVRAYGFADIQRINRGERPWGKKERRGHGDYVFCAQANNFIGHHYVPGFQAWTHDLARWRARVGSRPGLVYPISASSLAVSKQVVAMFLAADGALAERAQGLREFVLDPAARGLPPRVQLFAY